LKDYTLDLAICMKTVCQVNCWILNHHHINITDENIPCSTTRAQKHFTMQTNPVGVGEMQTPKEFKFNMRARVLFA